MIRQLHVIVHRDSAFGFSIQQNPGACPQSQALRPAHQRTRSYLLASLVEPSVTGLLQCLPKVQVPGVCFLPIPKCRVSNLQRRRTIEFILRADRVTLERGDADDDFKSRSGGIRRAIGPRQHWNVRVTLYLLELFLRNCGHKIIRIDSWPGSERKDFAGTWIDDHDGTAFRSFLKNFFRQPLDVHVDRSNEVVSRLWRSGNSLPGFVSVFVKGQIELTGFTAQLVLKRLLESFAPLTLRPKRFIILEDPCACPTRTTRISYDLASNRALRISTDVGCSKL